MRIAAHRLLAACAALLFAACEKPVQPAINLADASGATHAPLASDGRQATVLIFLMHDCPVANASAPALARLATDFAPRGVRFYGIYTTETAHEINTHRANYKLPFPGLLDPDSKLARHAGATRIPEAAVYSPAGELLYRGRVDDRATQPGSMKPFPSREDLRLALDAILAGKPVEQRITEAAGCYIPL